MAGDKAGRAGADMRFSKAGGRPKHSQVRAADIRLQRNMGQWLQSAVAKRGLPGTTKAIQFMAARAPLVSRNACRQKPTGIVVIAVPATSLHFFVHRVHSCRHATLSRSASGLYTVCIAARRALLVPTRQPGHLRSHVLSQPAGCLPSQEGIRTPRFRPPHPRTTSGTHPDTSGTGGVSHGAKGRG